MKDMKNLYLRDELYALVREDPAIFDFLQNGSLDGIWYWDIIDHEAEWLSPRFKQLFGYRDDEVPNTSVWWQNNIFPEDLQVALSNFQKHLEDPGHPYDQIVRYRHKDGSTVWVRCRGLIIRNDEGKAVRMLGAHTDVTDLKQAEENLQEANRKLELSNRRLEQFAYVTSHDLQEPLRMVASFCELLAKEYRDQVDDDGKQYLDFAVNGSKRMQEMIKGILAFSRLQSKTASRAPVNCNDAVDDAELQLMTAIRDSNGRVECSELPTISSDETLLVQLFQNLIGNSIKFRHKDRDPHVKIMAEQQENRWIFSVEDNGIGFDEKYRERIFGMFQRLNKRSEYDGTGIGLCLCQEIVLSLGGEIWVTSKLGIGSTFFFSLPYEP